jgi:hypothetical protein
MPDNSYSASDYNLSFCGNDCSLCPRHIATISGDVPELERLAALWVSLGWRDSNCTADDMKCIGCVVNDNCHYGLSECAKQKQIPNCGKCEEYPCSRCREVLEKSEINRQNCEAHCKTIDYIRLESAFFNKKTNLDRASITK